MKWFLTLFLALSILILPTAAHATAIGGQEFTKVIYIAAAALSPTPSASNSGRDYASAKPIANGNLWAVPKDVVVSNVYLVVDQAFLGGTAFNVGDTDGSTSYIASSSPLGAPENLGVVGLHYWDVGYKGAYLKGAAGQGLSNQQLAKYYSATGKFVTLSVTGTFNDGKARVFIKGYSLGNNGL